MQRYLYLHTMCDLHNPKLCYSSQAIVLVSNTHVGQNCLSYCEIRDLASNSGNSPKHPICRKIVAKRERNIGVRHALSMSSWKKGQFRLRCYSELRLMPQAFCLYQPLSVRGINESRCYPSSISNNRWGLVDLNIFFIKAD
jgi:hypothetical protein